MKRGWPSPRRSWRRSKRMKLADSRTIKKIDSAAMRKYGIRALVLMENAGRAVAEAVKKELEPVASKYKRVAIIAGKGNNGGDGFVAARHLMNSGVSVALFSFARVEDIRGDAGVNALAWQRMGGEINYLLSKGDLKKHEYAIRHSSIIVDAIFGTGLGSPVSGLYADTIAYMNGLERKIVSVDMPSGIDASTGAVLGVAVKASLTVTMAVPKIGLYSYPGRSFAGRVVVADIGAPRELIEGEAIRWNLITEDDLKKILKIRKPESHKSTHGHMLIVAGSPGMTGAAYMAGVASMRAGSGLTTIALPESLNPIMEAKTTEIMTLPVPEADGRLVSTSFEKIRHALTGKSVLLIGPGIGNHPGTFGLVEKLIDAAEIPTVLDADGLNAFAGNAKGLKKCKAPLVITPHPGEAARLLKTSTVVVQSDRMGAAKELARATGATVVLKGAGTVITGPDGQFYLNPTGNPGLATAGTGDVLSGMIGGLLAQGYTPTEAAIAAVYLHGLAGDRVKEAQGEAGMMATDLLPLIPGLLNFYTEAR